MAREWSALAYADRLEIGTVTFFGTGIVPLANLVPRPENQALPAR
jgi:hypothetical protein